MFNKQFIMLITSSCLLACATPDQARDEAAPGLRSSGTDCISDRTIRDYRVLDDRNLIVTAAGKRKYHVELGRSAYGLKSSWQLGFSAPSGRICPGFSDIVIAEGFGPEKIRIVSIALLQAEDEELLLIRFGLQEPEYELAPATEEVTGAGVEELD